MAAAVAVLLAVLAVSSCGQSSASQAFCYGQKDPCTYTRQADENPVVKLQPGTAWGDILVTNRGYTLYRFTRDSPGLSRCREGCLDRWPPLLLQSKQRLVAGPGLRTSDLGLARAPEGGRQVTYRGIPLYVYAMDQTPGDANGEYVDDEGLWFVVAPSTRSPGQGPPRRSPAPPPGAAHTPMPPAAG